MLEVCWRFLIIAYCKFNEFKEFLKVGQHLDRYVPRLLNRQAVGVQLGDEQEVSLLIGGVDGPQPVAVHGQVDVGVVIRVQDLFALCRTAGPHAFASVAAPAARHWGAPATPWIQPSCSDKARRLSRLSIRTF